MSETVQQVIASCEWDTTNFLVLSGNVFDPFIYYSHLVPLVISILIGYFIFFKNPRLLVNQILFVLTNLFAAWVFFDLILWATDNPANTIFFWSLVNLIEPFIYVFAVYFVQVFIAGKDTTLRSKILLFAPILPVIVLAFSNYNLLGFNLSNCDREAIEGPLAHYIYIIEVFYVIYLALHALHQFAFKAKEKRAQIILVSVSILCFLLAFSWGNIVGSLTDSWRVSQWGLFGMPVFIAVLAYLIIKYNLFDVKVVSTQILMTAFTILVGSQYFLSQSFGNRIITIITFILSTIAGILIVKSVKKEIEQRKKIEKLAEELKAANDRLRELDRLKSEFLSFASHQLRSPLTAIEGYASMLLEGDFGEMSEKVKTSVHTIDQSSKSLITIVNEFLDVSRIEQGRMKYDYSDFDVKSLAEEVVAELRPNVEAKGLSFEFTAKPGDYMIHADRGKVKQVIGNIVDNSIKYTPSGGVTVKAERIGGRIQVSITDTGIGIDPSEIGKLFSMFSRAKDAHKTNVSGTGLGLFVAKQMIEAQKGRVWVESPGKGKGSTFFIELPAKN